MSQQNSIPSTPLEAMEVLVNEVVYLSGEVEVESNRELAVETRLEVVRSLQGPEPEDLRQLIRRIAGVDN